MSNKHYSSFKLEHTIHELKHYLPAQAPLKDFIHHNTLHAFQSAKFFQGISNASQIFGYKVLLSLKEYRSLYALGKISDNILNKIITDEKGETLLNYWKKKAINKTYNTNNTPRIGQLREVWKTQYHMNLDSLVHPILFRVLCSYLDQGIALWRFPTENIGFLNALIEIEKNSYSSFFKTKEIKNLFISKEYTIESLLKIIVGDEALYEQYLFDQQFAHQGWSGMVATIENQPETLLNTKNITLKELITFELLLEIDAINNKLGANWASLDTRLFVHPENLFTPTTISELENVLQLWQKAFEWEYYNQVLVGMALAKPEIQLKAKSFQALFCIDDRECSFRRHLENSNPQCETFGTPGFFSVEFYFQPQDGKFFTKLCPAPITPKYLVKEIGQTDKRQKAMHLSKSTHSLLSGWLITQTLGFWSAVQLFFNIFKPKMSPTTSSSFKHMNKTAELSITFNEYSEHELQVGFKLDEMANRVENLLKSIGLVSGFAPIIYIVGHGASSVNNPHFAAYDCGACCGRPGSVNARVMCHMANHKEVRTIIAKRGINIPENTQFISALHDTTRDEIAFFDESKISIENNNLHIENKLIFEKALNENARERSRRFDSIDSKLNAKKIHKKILTRSVSLFEPRPELNHATNALCIVGRRELSKGLFLDRRSFLNSYNYEIDPEGKYLLNILNAAAPVCGGINLEYFFSRTDNYKLGAGTKLPHNVMGLIGVANGIDGDLRPGLPSQMIEMHDPLRLLMIVEHFPEVVLNTIQKNESTYQWFINEWVNLVVVNPENKQFYHFKNGIFEQYNPLAISLNKLSESRHLLEQSNDNIPVLLIH